MEVVMKNGFAELSESELETTDGGVVIFGVTIAGLTLLKIAGCCAGAGITAGITVGLSRKNRK